MKYLKKYGLFESNTEIDSICQKFGIDEDGTVDVDGDVDLSKRNLSKLPLKFGKVSGNFHCNRNKLISLEGCPEEVGGDFYCHRNQLTSLLGCPKYVGINFACAGNQLTSLEYCPEVVNGSFYCSQNKLTSLEGCPKEVGGDFYCNNNQITTIKGELEFVKVPPNIENNPIQEVYQLFPTFKSFQYSLDYNYFREPNLIVKHRFEEACEEAGITVPEKIIGYQYI